MELFSEIYGCYYTVVSRILEQAQNGLSKAEMERLVESYGFYDSTFHLLPSLLSGEWNLLTEKNNLYYSKLSGTVKRPLTTLEKSWLKALLGDSRIQLFLDEKQLAGLQEFLTDSLPLYIQSDFHMYDQHLDGDPFLNKSYIARFRIILSAVASKQPLVIEYDSGKGKRTKRRYYPHRLLYSVRDNKFRLQCAVLDRQHQLQKVILNLARITAVQIPADQFSFSWDLSTLFQESVCTDPVVLEISKERNALERCMLQFASFERQTEYDKKRDIYTCRIWYDPADETELLIRILSFGPVVKVLGPARFLKQIEERIYRQIRQF